MYGISVEPSLERGDYVYPCFHSSVLPEGLCRSHSFLLEPSLLDLLTAPDYRSSGSRLKSHLKQPPSLPGHQPALMRHLPPPLFCLLFVVGHPHWTPSSQRAGTLPDAVSPEDGTVLRACLQEKGENEATSDVSARTQGLSSVPRCSVFSARLPSPLLPPREALLMLQDSTQSAFFF